MKIICVPDIHGFNHWKKVIPLVNKVDKIIFLGDYVDSFKNKWPEQIKNLYAIFRFKRENTNKVDILLGNHDTSYILEEHCSGFQPEHEFDIYEAFNINKHLYQIISIYDNYLFSHAGVSAEWMYCAGIKDVNEINQLFLERPNFFRWVGPDGAGRNNSEGPLWIRENLCCCNVKGYNQIVGHTEILEKNSSLILRGINNEKLIYIDTPSHNTIISIDTKSELIQKV
jgi:hypothetical protein